MAYQNGNVRQVYLKNQGGFVVEMDFQIKKVGLGDERLSGSGHDITLGLSETVDPGNYGVKHGDEFCIHADVKLGLDKKSDWLTYDKDSTRVAKFVISGTTLDNDLALIGFEEIEE